MQEKRLENLYAAASAVDVKSRYQDWAANYEAELLAMGYRLPWHFAAIVQKFLPDEQGPILDAGCGGGLQMEPLALLGLKGVIGADLSPAMMEVARRKNIYDELVEVTLGEKLPFADHWFRASFCVGTITPGHAPPHAIDELARVTKMGGLLIFSLRTDQAQKPEYPAYVEKLSAQGVLREIYRSPSFLTMPLAAREIENCIYVCEVLK